MALCLTCHNPLTKTASGYQLAEAALSKEELD